MLPLSPQQWLLSHREVYQLNGGVGKREEPEPHFDTGDRPSGNIPSERDPATPRNVQGSADKTLYLAIPKRGLQNIPIYNSLSEEKLSESAIHVPETGFLWQPGANTYIAGYRLGFVGTGSFLVFLKLNELESGDEILLKDSTGKHYRYRVTGARVVTPQAVEVINP